MMHPSLASSRVCGCLPFAGGTSFLHSVPTRSHTLTFGLQQTTTRTSNIHLIFSFEFRIIRAPPSAPTERISGTVSPRQYVNVAVRPCPDFAHQWQTADLLDRFGTRSKFLCARRSGCRQTVFVYHVTPAAARDWVQFISSDTTTPDPHSLSRAQYPLEFISISISSIQLSHRSASANAA